MKTYELIYSVTKKCQNGKEQTREKKVYVLAERDNHDIVDIAGTRYFKAENYLKNRHYYNIYLVDERLIEMAIIA